MFARGCCFTQHSGIDARNGMDVQTAEFYRNNAQECLDRYEAAQMGALHAMLRALVHPGCRVLELGGGSGRDAAFLASVGCDVTYTDGCEEMFCGALERHPFLKEHSRLAAFPLMPDDSLLSERFDIVLCIAVLMHLQGAEFQTTVAQIAQMTVPYGCVVASHPAGRAGLVAHRDPAGRLFCERADAEVMGSFSSTGFAIEARNIENDSLGRTELGWITHILRKGS
ncbi:MAG: class I SAM-dependent methyltransferase [Patescibacteria group bacterium]|nr:class I SAM-dependent methyltransferase [Patescibacteria group bacterium]